MILRFCWENPILPFWRENSFVVLEGKLNFAGLTENTILRKLDFVVLGEKHDLTFLAKNKI